MGTWRGTRGWIWAQGQAGTSKTEGDTALRSSTIKMCQKRKITWPQPLLQTALNQIKLRSKSNVSVEVHLPISKSVLKTMFLKEKRRSHKASTNESKTNSKDGRKRRNHEVSFRRRGLRAARSVSVVSIREWLVGVGFEIKVRSRDLWALPNRLQLNGTPSQQTTVTEK